MKKNAEIEKLKNMAPKDIPWYIWEYYKIPILAILLLLIISVSLIPSLFNQKKTVLTVYFINNPVHEDGAEPIREGFSEYAGLNTASQQVEMDASMSIDADDSLSYGYEYIMKLTVVMAAGDLDVLLTDTSMHEYYMNHNAYVDLSEYLPAGLLAKHKDRLLYSEDENGISRPFGIDVSDSPVLQAVSLPNLPVYYGIIANSQHKDMNILFLEYLLNSL